LAKYAWLWLWLRADRWEHDKRPYEIIYNQLTGIEIDCRFPVVAKKTNMRDFPGFINIQQISSFHGLIIKQV